MRATWLLAVLLNLVLGVVALVPLIATLFALHAVAHALGWATYSPVDPDEHEAVVLVIVLGWLILLPAAYALNRLVLRRTAPVRFFWPVAAIALATPYLALCLRAGTVLW